MPVFIYNTSQLTRWFILAYLAQTLPPASTRLAVYLDRTTHSPTYVRFARCAFPLLLTHTQGLSDLV